MPAFKNFESYINKVDSVQDNRSMFGYLRKDIPASLVVFLVALPLCLGIALASGAPLASGLISGIIGGLVVGYISKSGTSVSGPAASVSAVALAAIISLGRYELFLVAVTISGIFQIILGRLKAGFIADYMPTSIIKGLLAGIGVILIVAQLPYVFGLEIPKGGLIDYSSDYIAQFSDIIPTLLSTFSPGALIIAIISFAVIIFWDRTPLKKLNWFPASLFVVFLGVILNIGFEYLIPQLHLSGSTLVIIPAIENLNEFIIFPDFYGLLNFEVWTTAITITVVASVATLLNIEATDDLDRYKRKTPPNRELIAQGIGNTLAGLIGGLPITSVIVRSSVNINAGAETKLSTILHGLLLLISVLFMSSVINMIPLASLAVILIATGYKLASIETFKKLYKKGWDQFIPFVITVVCIVTIDLLIGILIGSGVAVFFLLKSNYYNPFVIENTKTFDGELIRLELSNEVSFLNKASIKNTLWSMPRNSNLVIDATFSSFIDKDVLDIIYDFRNTFAVEHDINVRVVGLKETYKSGVELAFTLSEKKPFPKTVSTPDSALDLLKEGNKRYAKGTRISRRLRNRENISHQNSPAYALILGCLDLRESSNVLMDTGMGDLVTLRSAAHFIGPDVIRNMEMVCQIQDIKLVVLLGHSENQLIEKAVKNSDADPSSYLSTLVSEAVVHAGRAIPKDESLDFREYVDIITRWNLHAAKNEILRQSKYLKSESENGHLQIVSAFLNRESGEISFWELVDEEGMRV